jgi:hypothetical protein
MFPSLNNKIRNTVKPITAAKATMKRNLKNK